MKAFLFVIAIISNEGELQMKAIEVEACPAKEEFVASMEQMKNSGQLKEWNAICYELPKGQGV